jgi:nucleotide-binding universal stress UspA family protein
LVKILVPTAGPEPARRNADRIVNIAKNFNAELIIVHIRDQGEERGEGDQAFDIFSKAAISKGVQHKMVPAIGEISSTIIGQAKFHDADIILMGATEGRGVAGWIMDRIMSSVDIPVLILPWTSK